MRKFALGIVALALASTANAQIFNPAPAAQATAPDLSAYAQKSDVTAAIAPLATNSALNAVQAQIPPACTVTPMPDTLNGTVGTTTPCTPPANNTRPTAVQAGNTTLTASCTFTVTFARAFVSATPFVFAAVVDNAGNQMPCKTQTRSATGFTGICQGSQSTVLSLSIVTSGLTLLPFGTTCTAGTPVMFVGREPTQ